MFFYAVRGRDILLWLVGVLVIVFGVSLCITPGWEPTHGAAAASIELNEPPVAVDGFSLEVISVTSGQKPRRRIYLYHTHTYEAYEQDAAKPYRETEKWRTADAEYNMIRVGAELAALLRDAGIEVYHDRTAYEMPRLSTAYARSLLGMEQAAKEGYDLYIDLHRDSYSAGNGANTIERQGKQLARLLFLIGKGTGTALDEKPDWQKNQAAAEKISARLNAQAAGLSRGISLKSGRYNQQAAVPSMLIEVGNNKNTLQEALNAMPCLAQAICAYFDALE